MKTLVCGVIGAVALCIACTAIASEIEPVIVKQEHTETVIGVDRHATRTLHLELQATNDSAAAEIGEQAVPYNETMQTLEIVEAYTLKANGERIDVAPDAIHVQQRRESPQQSLYNDLRQKVIIFPNIAGGDSIVLTARWRQVEHYIPGHFFLSEFYTGGHTIEDASETVVAPKDFPLYVENHGLDIETLETSDTITRRWRYGSKGESLDEPRLIDPDDVGPRVYLSSVKSYEELGRVYGEVVSPKIAVTPAIEALTREVTAGTTDRRTQAERLYGWVSRNIRYVALEFGAGGIIPHDAGSVLARGYGDCKDHAVLLAALLKAKGIEAQIVLIDAGDKYTLSNVPRISQFNHAIVYLPEFDVYVDATAGVAPFGVLPFAEYGKPVVHAVSSGTVVRRTPVMPATTLTLRSDAYFDAEGKVIEDSTIEADGAFSIAFRNSAQAIQSQGTSRYIAARTRSSGSGANGTIKFSDPLQLDPHYGIKSHIEYEARPEWLSGDGRFGMRRSIVPTPFPGDFLMGPLSLRGLSGDEPTACYSGRIIEEMSFRPPSGRRFARLPDDIQITTANLEFTSRWSSMGDRFIQHREFRSELDQPLCTGEVRRETHKALIEIGEYYARAVLHLEPEGTN